MPRHHAPMPPHERHAPVPPAPYDEPTHAELMDAIAEMRERLDRIERMLGK